MTDTNCIHTKLCYLIPMNFISYSVVGCIIFNTILPFHMKLDMKNVLLLQRIISWHGIWLVGMVGWNKKLDNDIIFSIVFFILELPLFYLLDHLLSRYCVLGK